MCSHTLISCFYMELKLKMSEQNKYKTTHWNILTEAFRGLSSLFIFRILDFVSVGWETVVCHSYDWLLDYLFLLILYESIPCLGKLKIGTITHTHTACKNISNSAVDLINFAIALLSNWIIIHMFVFMFRFSHAIVQWTFDRFSALYVPPDVAVCHIRSF